MKRRRAAGAANHPGCCGMPSLALPVAVDLQLAEFASGLVARMPAVESLANAECLNETFVGPLRGGYHTWRNQPHSAAERFLLFDGDEVARDVEPDHGRQHGSV